MKKLLFSVLIFFTFISGVQADTTKEKVTFHECVDGDTAKFLIDNEIKTVRFLAIDTPESVPTAKTEAYGKEASDYTCHSLKTAKEIILEYESSNTTDKYGRTLAWVWVDDTLIQDELIKHGYAEVAYIYGNYKYTDLLKDHEALAQANLTGLWGEEDRKNQDTSSCNGECNDHEDINDYWLTIALSVCLVIVFILSPTYRKKKTRQLKRKITNKVNKEFDDLIK